MELSIREAVRNDTRELLGDLSKDIFQGLDYFPGWLESMWTQEGRKMWVCVDADGRIAGLETMLLVDNGRTAVPQCLRVLPDFRGKGVSKLLSIHLQKYVATVPSIKRIRATTRNDNKATIAIHEKDGFNIPFKQGACIFHPVLANGEIEGVPCMDQLVEHDAEKIAAFVKPYTASTNEMLIAEWTPRCCETHENTVRSVEAVQKAGFTFLVDEERKCVSYWKLAQYPRGPTIVVTVLGNDGKEAFMAHALYYANKGVQLACHSVELFYDVALFRNSPLPEVLVKLEAITKAPFDTERFNLTGAGLCMIEKVL